MWLLNLALISESLKDGSRVGTWAWPLIKLHFEVCPFLSAAIIIASHRNFTHINPRSNHVWLCFQLNSSTLVYSYRHTRLVSGTVLKIWHLASHCRLLPALMCAKLSFMYLRYIKYPLKRKYLSYAGAAATEWSGYLKPGYHGPLFTASRTWFKCCAIEIPCRVVHIYSDLR